MEKRAFPVSDKFIFVFFVSKEEKTVKTEDVDL